MLTGNIIIVRRNLACTLPVKVDVTTCLPNVILFDVKLESFEFWSDKNCLMEIREEEEEQKKSD